MATCYGLLSVEHNLQVSRRSILSIEARPIRKTASSGVEFQLMERSMRDLMLYYEMLVESDHELWHNE